jgi:hypothetical protein
MFLTGELSRQFDQAASLERARRRVDGAGGLSNVRLELKDVRAFREHFHVGLALHACGEVTRVEAKGLRNLV